MPAGKYGKRAGEIVSVGMQPKTKRKAACGRACRKVLESAEKMRRTLRRDCGQPKRITLSFAFGRSFMRG